MKKLFFIASFFMLLGMTACSSKDRDVLAVEQLTHRLIPQYADRFVFEIVPDEDRDYYSLESKDGKIHISGNNANSMAAGLNYYLKYYCLTTVSWYADIPVEMPDVLPMVEKPVVVEAKVDNRFFLNYCTYGYSMPFWKWKDWERFIDWMALNGVNMPLAITGQEMVWYKVWKKIGLTMKRFVLILRARFICRGIAWRISMAGTGRYPCNGWNLRPSCRKRFWLVSVN